MRKLNIAVIGAGLIGRDHIALIQQSTQCQLSAIADHSEQAQAFAAKHHIACRRSLTEVLAAGDVDGVILATPNHLHVAQAIECLDAGVPALVEKPVAHNLLEGQRLLQLSKKSSTPLMVGHHRMYSPIITTAKAAIDQDILGQLVAVSGTALFYKPDNYFAAGHWRTQPGGGPILINMIHEIGNLRYLCGEICSVQALSSNARRGFAVEDTVGVLLAFDSGAVGTFLLSDTAGSACSWEQTSQENPDYASYPGDDCYHIAGTQGSLSIPTMRLKTYNDTVDRSWYQAFDVDTLPIERLDPLACQLEHFCGVINGGRQPLVDVFDGLQNLRVTEAIVEASKTGQKVILS